MTFRFCIFKKKKKKKQTTYSCQNAHLFGGLTFFTDFGAAHELSGKGWGWAVPTLSVKQYNQHQLNSTMSWMLKKKLHV